MSWLSMTAASMASGVLAALAAAFAPALASSLVELARVRSRKCLLWGTLAAFGATLAGGVLAGAAVRAPEGAGLVFATASLTLLSTLLALSIVAAAVAIAAAGTLFKLSFLEKPYQCVAAGFAAATIACALPYVGDAFRFGLLAWGAGAVILRLRGERA